MVKLINTLVICAFLCAPTSSSWAAFSGSSRDALQGSRDALQGSASVTAGAHLPSLLEIGSLSSRRAAEASDGGGSLHKDHFYKPILVPLAEGFAFLAICWVCVSSAMVFANLVYLGCYVALDKDGPPGIGFIRRDLSFGVIKMWFARAIVVGLDLLVVADVIETLAETIHNMTFENLGKISAMVAIRTVLSLHLLHEKHAAHKLVHEAGHGRPQHFARNRSIRYAEDVDDESEEEQMRLKEAPKITNPKMTKLSSQFNIN